MKRYITPELREKRRRAGRLGGCATSSRYPREQRVAWARMGGRPRLKTLAELEGQLCAPGLKNKGGRLPAVTLDGCGAPGY